MAVKGESSMQWIVLVLRLILRYKPTAIFSCSSIESSKANLLENITRVGIVSYLNTRPLLYGIEHSALINDMVLIQDYPARIAEKLLDDSIDVGLIPVAVIPKLKESYIVTDYCIGCNGPVASVCIFSEVPLTEVEEVLLDYQSRTSVTLARLLLKEYWRLKPKLIDTRSEYQSKIKGTTAGLLIGDRALAQRKISTFAYDLGEAWKNHTGLPFVFAAWVSNKKLPEDFVSKFNQANKEGLSHIDKIVELNPSPVFDLKKYFTSHISYLLDDEKKKGLKLFLEKMKNPARAGL
jgi:chorismate dehydratase